jgi:hypothetical protein
MEERRVPWRRWAVLAALGVGLTVGLPLPGEAKPRSAARPDKRPAAHAKTKMAWTYDEALAQLRLNPRDPYLQYVVMQLGWRNDKAAEAAAEVEKIVVAPEANLFGRTRDRRDVDLFNLFSGALAVQESLQMDAMSGGARQAASHLAARNTLPVVSYYFAARATGRKQAPARPEAERDRNRRIALEVDPPAQPNGIRNMVYKWEEVEKKDAKTDKGGLIQSWIDAASLPPGPPLSSPVPAPLPRLSDPVPAPAPPPTPEAPLPPFFPTPIISSPPASEPERPKKDTYTISELKGPEVKSHPWKKMLGHKKPGIDPLAKLVPHDNYFVQFRSLAKLLEVMGSGDLWCSELYGQAVREARQSLWFERLRKQLGLDDDKTVAALDLCIEEVAATGGDLYFTEGGEVTLVFRLKDAAGFKRLLDRLGSRPDLAKHLFTAFPADGVGVLSNSRVGLERVLAAVKGKDAAGKKVNRLGDDAEFAYIRTLMPRGAKEEDGFVYLSDPFMRRFVGPEVRLAQRRRLIAYNHLRMIGHAALMYRTEFGKAPQSLEELARAKCTPGQFNKGDLVCPGGGKYSLAADGLTGVNSVYGTAANMTPLVETPLQTVSASEADEYDAFVKQYSEYWKDYFDPIALRIQATPRRYRIETLVLPLIDNSIYTTLASGCAGKPAALDDLPVPRGNILSFACRLNKDALKDYPEGLEKEWLPSVAAELGLAAKDLEGLSIKKLLTEGFGDQIGFHVCDSEPAVELDAPQLLGFLGGVSEMDAAAMQMMALTAFNSPVYVSLPVRDASVVDTFGDALEKVFAAASRRRARLSNMFMMEAGFYKAPLDKTTTMRAVTVTLGPVKFRGCWARIGQTVFIASKDSILKDLLAAEKARAETKREPDPDATGHLLVRLRPKNWNGVLAGYKLNRVENNRQAALDNLGPLASMGRALAAEHGPAQEGEDRTADALALAEKVYGVRFVCPDGGKYVLSADGKSCSSSVHGTVLEPRQAAEPVKGEDALFSAFGGLTMMLTFRDDGLRAVVVVEKK